MSLDSSHEEGAALAPVVNGARGVEAHADVWAEARRLVEETKLPQGVIARELGLSPTTLSARKNREGWTRPPGAPEAFLLSGGRQRWSGVEKPDKAAARRTRLTGRLYRAFERQIADVEARAFNPKTKTEEKDARTLGTLARTLATLMALDRDDGATAKEPERVDRGKLNAELARRIARWAEGGDRI